MLQDSLLSLTLLYAVFQVISTAMATSTNSFRFLHLFLAIAGNSYTSVLTHARIH